ncbi:MAG: sugar transferase [Clostridia bacterium]|nr:sugar transferase [Deltaproteobacteria bacterium]
MSGLHQRLLKRAIDVVVATGALTVSWPVIAVLGACVKATSEGPAIFAQTRVGKNGRPFVCYKLRTMAANTPQLASHEVGRSAVTPLGNILRKTKLDELPQLWNVLRGDMTLVGPRPCLTTQSALITCREERGVFTVRPGITGLAQVQGVDMSEPEALASIDAEYVASQSLIGDLRIMLQTFSGRGSGDRTRLDR